VTVLDERAVRRHDGPAEDFTALLVGARLQAPRRRGKFLWVPIDGADDPSSALLTHLGMSGQVLLRAPDAPDERHTRIRIDVRHPDHGAVRIHFADQRLFGSMSVDVLTDARDAPGDAAERLPFQAVHIARDPLDPRFDERAVVRALRAKRTEVKRALLDQTLVSGIGNIYADEALWAARVHPRQPTATLSAPAATRLIGEARSVLLRALEQGGTSFDAQYLNVNGESGYFSRSLHVYGRQGTPCDRCGASIVRERFMNRGSHFCPTCQPAP